MVVIEVVDVGRPEHSRTVVPVEPPTTKTIMIHLNYTVILSAPDSLYTPLVLYLE